MTFQLASEHFEFANKVLLMLRRKSTRLFSFFEGVFRSSAYVKIRNRILWHQGAEQRTSYLTQWENEERVNARTQAHAHFSFAEHRAWQQRNEMISGVMFCGRMHAATKISHALQSSCLRACAIAARTCFGAVPPI
jgi:hypothetical protein